MTAYYATTSRGQVGLCVGGRDGAAVVVLAGPLRSATTLLSEVVAALPSRRVVVVEPPGVGGSAGVRFASVEEAGGAVSEALEFLRGGGPVDVVALDLAAVLVAGVRDTLPDGATVLVDAASAQHWADQPLRLPSLTARDDGTHLTALWAFLRDRRLTRSDDPRRPVADGPPLPDAADLDASFLAAVVAPERFAAFWNLATHAIHDSLQRLPDARRVRALPAVADVIGDRPDPVVSPTPTPTSPAPDGQLFCDYVETELGRVHLRRAGSAGRPVLVLPTGGGSSEQFAPVLTGLARTRTAVAMDYFGNGLSDKLDRAPDTATLAREAFAVADALGWDELDVWGSHTGANVALEMAIMAPDRIGRAVLEAPVMVSPELRDDLLEHYFPDLTPDPLGGHLTRVWNWRRDMFFYWPWYRVEHAATRDIGIPAAADLQTYAVGILQSGRTYDLAYRSGFSYDTWSRLPQLCRPAILTAGPHDMLGNALQDAASLVPGDLLQIVETPATVWWPEPEPDAAEATLQVYREFLQ